MLRSFLKFLLINFISAQAIVFSQTENLPDKLPDDLNQEQWELVRDLYAVDAIKLLARLDTLNLQIDSLKQLNEYTENYNCEAELFALVGATKEQVSDFRIKFDEAERYITGKSGTPDNASKNYFEMISNSKIKCLPEFADRLNSLRKIAANNNTRIENNISQNSYSVVKGDCLWKISSMKYNSPYLWSAIWEANKNEVTDPNFIYPGEVLKIPAITDEDRKKAIELSKKFRNRKKLLDNLQN